MKKLLLTLSLLLVPVSLLAQQPAPAPASPEIGATAAQPAGSLTAADLERILTPSAEWKIVNPCTRLNTNYCSYTWNPTTGCCIGTVKIPGSFCGNICQ